MNFCCFAATLKFEPEGEVLTQSSQLTLPSVFTVFIHPSKAPGWAFVVTVLQLYTLFQWIVRVEKIFLSTRDCPIIIIAAAQPQRQQRPQPQQRPQRLHAALPPDS
jgi:hypothetical protein